MSIARAFTTRRVRQTLEFKDKNEAAGSTSSGFLHRSKTAKPLASQGSIRHKISAPVELTHTTNMLSYNAPDIIPVSVAVDAVAPTSSPSTSSKSDDESDSGFTAVSTPPTSPDTPYPSGDKRSMSPEPNHLSCYFTPPRQAAAESTADASSPSTAPAPAAASTADAPIIPQRAPSHTKKSYDSLVRQRSVSRMSEQSARSLSTKASFSFSRSSSSSTTTSVTSAPHTPAVKASHTPSSSVASHAANATASFMSSPTPPVSHKKEYSESHPFGHELAKVSELVEEFTKEEEQLPVLEQPLTEISSNPVVAEEERELARLGLKKYSAESYITDIQSLMSSFFADARPMATVWI